MECHKNYRSTRKGWSNHQYPFIFDHLKGPPQNSIYSFSQWPNFKLFGITFSRENKVQTFFLQGPLAEWVYNDRLGSVRPPKWVLLSFRRWHSPNTLGQPCVRWGARDGQRFCRKKNKHPLGFHQHPNWKMLVCIPYVFNFHVRNLFVWWNLFFLQIDLGYNKY